MIATVLLIGIVVMIGVIIFLWFKNLQQETITKFGGTNVELVCDEVRFDASYSEKVLYISNTGNVPIYSMNIKISGEGSYETESISGLSTWPSQGLNQGAAFSGVITINNGADKIRLIPILLGSSTEGEKAFTCEERYGHEIDV